MDIDIWEEKLRQAAEYVKQGNSPAQACIKFDLPPFYTRYLKQFKENRPAKIVELYQKGYKIKDIAEICKCSIQNVYTILRKRFGYKKPVHQKKITEEIKNKVIELRKQGKTLWEIRKLTDISEVSLRKILREYFLNEQQAN